MSYDVKFVYIRINNIERDQYGGRPPDGAEIEKFNSYLCKHFRSIKKIINTARLYQLIYSTSRIIHLNDRGQFDYFTLIIRDK